jgi:cytochrome b561
LPNINQLEERMKKTAAQPFEFSTLSKWLHWGSMVLLFALMIAGTSMVGLEDGSPQKMTIYRIHGLTGLLIVLLTLARIIIRLRRPQPLPEGMTEKWNIWLHGIVQWAIYLVLLGIGVSGMGTLALNSTTAFTVDPAALDRTVPTIQGHFLMTRLYLLLVFLHLAGVLRHQFTRSNILRRMGLNLPVGKINE